MLAIGRGAAEPAAVDRLAHLHRAGGGDGALGLVRREHLGFGRETAMLEDALDLASRIGDELGIIDHQDAVRQERGPEGEKLVLDPEMRRDVLQLPAPVEPANEVGAECGQRAIERVAAQPDDRRLRQQGGDRPDVAGVVQPLVDVTPLGAEALTAEVQV